MLTRRQFLLGGAALAGSAACARPVPGTGSVLVNDLHSQLNPAWVDRVVVPDSIQTLRRVVRSPEARARGISIAGGRHTMGGQQFGAGTVLLDMRGLNRVLRFDPDRGQVEAEGGARWPALLDALSRAQQGHWPQWGIVQKQTGADRLSLGGALARPQVEACHPRFVEFLRQKRSHDPEERFQSDWYRHYRAMFADVL